MYDELATANKLVGVKQAKKAVAQGMVKKAFFAEDADERILSSTLEQCQNLNVPIVAVPTMKELGRACGIEVGAAIAVLL